MKKDPILENQTQVVQLEMRKQSTSDQKKSKAPDLTKVQVEEENDE